MPTFSSVARRSAQRQATERTDIQNVSRQQTNLLARGLAVNPESEALRNFFHNFGDDLDQEQLARLGIQAPVDEEGGGGILGRIGRIIDAVPGASQALDLLGRPGQAVLQGIKGAREDGASGVGAILGAPFLSEGFREGFVGGLTGRGEETTATDAVLGEGRGPGGILGGVLDFAGGALLDPTTYLTFGTSGIAKNTLGTLAREGAEAGLSDAARSIAARGLRGAERAGLADSAQIRQFLLQRAEGAGVRNAERTVGRQMRHLARSGGGGARFAGMTLPGTRGIESGLRPLRRVNILDTPARGGLLQGARDRASNLFRTANESRREFGDFVSGDVAQARTAGHVAAERAAQEWGPDIARIAKDIPNMKQADPYIRQALLAVDQLPEAAAKAAGDLGSTHTAQLGPFDEVVEAAPEAIRPEAAAAASGLRAIYDDIDRVGREMDYEVPSVSELVDDAVENGDTVADAMLRQVTRVSAASGFRNTFRQLDGLTDNFGNRLVFNEAAYRGLSHEARQSLEKVKGLDYYAPKSIISDVSNTLDFLTTDEGLKQFTAALNRANSLWKAYATVLPAGFGFFGRNQNGNLLAMLSAGVDMRNMGRAFKMMSKVRRYGVDALSEADRRIWNAAVEQGAKESGFIFQEASSSLAEMRRLAQKGGGGKLKRGLEQVNPLNMENVALRTGRKVNTFLEDSSRLTTFIDSIEKGYSPTQAAQRVKKYLFDYADLTPFEREKIKPWVAFYTYMRNNVPLQAEMLVTRPGILTAQAHAVEAAQANLAEGAPSLFPTYPFSGSAAVPTPAGVFNLDLPLTSAAAQLTDAYNALSDVLLKRDPSAAFQVVLNQMSGIRPAIGKAMAETVTKQDLFTGGPLDSVSDRRGAVIDQLFPGVRKVRRAAEQINSALTDGERAQLLPFFLGIGYVPINDDTQLGEMYRRLDRIEAFMDGMGEVPTLAELRDLGIIPGAPSQAPRLSSGLEGRLSRLAG